MTLPCWMGCPAPCRWRIGSRWHCSPNLRAWRQSAPHQRRQRPCSRPPSVPPKLHCCARPPWCCRPRFFLCPRPALQNDAADERSNLQEESRKTVAEATETHQYNKFTSSYGPPTQATLDGSWTKAVQQGANPGLDDTTRFARDILNKTVNRISRSVSHTRSSSTM